MEFQDLEYELKRQGSDSGNSYVGQRLAKGRQEQNEFCVRVESPRKHNNTNNLIGLQVRIILCFDSADVKWLLILKINSQLKWCL